MKGTAFAAAAYFLGSIRLVVLCVLHIIIKAVNIWRMWSAGNVYSYIIISLQIKRKSGSGKERNRDKNGIVTIRLIIVTLKNTLRSRIVYKFTAGIEAIMIL